MNWLRLRDTVPERWKSKALKLSAAQRRNKLKATNSVSSRRPFLSGSYAARAAWYAGPSSV